ncbi:MAG TPA: PAS domain S-box protein [Nitrospira sp.]|nr:PAS domain S-box protein [Nitrospira sp.]
MRDGRFTTRDTCFRSLWRHPRSAAYAAIVVLFLLLSALLSGVSWHGDGYTHRMLETASSLVAAMVGAMALTRYYSRRERTFLFVGIAFVGTGLLDAYHAVMTSPDVMTRLPPMMAHVTPWSWMPSRLFLASMLLGNLAVCYGVLRARPRWNVSDRLLYLAAAVAMVLTCAIFFVVPLPRSVFPDWPIPRPLELPMTALFLVVLVGHLKEGSWQAYRYDHWLVLGMLTECLTHACLMARSTALHDTFFIAAHVTKPLGYLCVLAGLIIDMSELFQKLEMAIERNKHARVALRQAHDNLGQRVLERTTELEASQRFISSVLEHLPHMVFVKDAHTLRFLEFNRAGEDLTGWSRAELLGKCDYDFFPKDQADFFTEKDRTTLANRSLVEIPEERIETKHRGVRLLHTKKIPICDRHGMPQYLLGISEDITERRAAETAALKNQAKLAEAQQLAGLGSWELDLATDTVTWSDESYRIFEIDPEQFGATYQAFLDTVHPADRDAVDLAYRYSVEHREPYGIEHRLLMKDGRVKYVHERGRTDYDPSGKPVRSVGTVLDITERRRLDQTQFMLQQAINHGLDGMALMDHSGRYTYMNPAYAEMYGYRADALLGRNWKDLFFPEWADLVDELSRPDLEQHGRWQGEVVGRTRTGESIHVDLSLAVLNHADQQGARMLVSTCRDITKRKLMERDLVAAKDSAEAAARAKAEFLATMSHEIRTPMNGVIGMTGLLLDTPLSSEQRDYAETVRRSGEALLAIINDILDFSKIEAGRLTLEHIEFDLRTTVEETLDLLAEQAHRKQLEIVGLIDGSVPTALRGDPGRLRQIMTNLVGNAIKFTDRGEVVLKLSTFTPDAGPVTLRFEISDTGIGIPAEAQSRLFQSFSQADGSTTRKFGGTGLGLAISKQLVEKMGGQIGVESEPGRGSTFWFTVRLERQADRAVPPSPSGNLAGLRICLIDDNATTRMLLEHHARTWGMNHASAQDARQAMALLTEHASAGHPFDLALVDMEMPGTGGLEFARQVKADPILRATRLILLTSLGRRGEAKLAQERGFSAYLTKPIHQRQLYECLKLVMGRDSDPAPEHHLVTVHTVSEERARTSGRILLAEDNVINQKVAVKMLEKLGHHVDVVANGEEAVEALSRIPYVLVFMDCQMPEMDGYEASRRIRAREASLAKLEAKKASNAMPDASRTVSAGHVPIIAMTANAMQEDRDLCLAAGMDDYISKPVTAKSLRTALDRWLAPCDRNAPRADSAQTIDSVDARH